MINKLITDSSFYNIAKSSNSINTNSNTVTKSSNVANKYIDTVQQFSNTTKSGKSVANTYNNVVKNYDSIAKSNNGFSSGGGATENVDPDEYNIPESTRWRDSAGVLYLRDEPLEAGGLIYSGGGFAGPVYQLRYAEHSTDENPIISARGHDENGKEFTQLITVNKINPSNATPIEMTALQAHLNGGQLYHFPEFDVLMDGVKSYNEHGINLNEHGINLNDRNNYMSALEDNITLRSQPSHPDSPEFAQNLSEILDGLLGFMSKNKINYQENSLKSTNHNSQKLLQDLSNELNDLSKSMSKDKTDLDDEFLKLLDKNKEDNNDK